MLRNYTWVLGGLLENPGDLEVEMNFHHWQQLQIPFEIWRQPISQTDHCDVVVPGPAIFFHSPDFGNLYHTFFDLVVPLFDTLVKDYGAAGGPGRPGITLVMVHDLILSGIVPDPEHVTAPVLGPEVGYRFLPYLGSITPHELVWIIPSERNYEFDAVAVGESEIPWIRPPAGKVSRSYCFSEITLNLDTTSSIWALTDDYHPLGSAMITPHHPHVAIYREVFGRRIPALFGFDPPPSLDGAPSDALSVTLLVRSGDRPTNDVAGLVSLLELVLRELEETRRVPGKLEVFDAATMSLSDQVSHFSRTHILIANHGAGMSNMVFMPAGSGVLELADIGGDYFRPLASIMGLHYARIPPARDDGTWSPPGVRRKLQELVESVVNLKV